MIDDPFAPRHLAKPRALSVSEFLDQCNAVFTTDFDRIEVEGEVASFKINQGKWVFFDLKEGDVSVNCFMVRVRRGMPLEDGMKVRVRATPKLTRWGKFSLTVDRLLPIGEGSIKKSFELLKQKLTKEGLFNLDRKRPLPENLTKIGVISSTQAAGYLDFLKILENRWGGLQVQTINTQVQGLAAPEQIIRALDYFNQQGQVEVIAILRGGGSADDLSAFNDEQLVRAIAASKIPVITGIGHEVDESLADLAADLRASTPSNAAERLTRDRQVALRQLRADLARAGTLITARLERTAQECRCALAEARREFLYRIDQQLQKTQEAQRILRSVSPQAALERGYAIIRTRPQQNHNNFSPGDQFELTTAQQTLIAEVIHAQTRS